VCSNKTVSGFFTLPQLRLIKEIEQRIIKFIMTMNKNATKTVNLTGDFTTL
jgi:hypothetical protein